MNKKFFSAVLMGALLLGGTFVSCQDYDDDIDNLQEQINKLASADQLSSKVSELQSAISAAQSAAEAKAAAANTVAEAAKKAAGDADAKAAAAQKAADDVKAAAGNYATKEEATAAANAAQKVANDLKSALETAVTEADINKAIDAALETALAKYATTEALAELSAELDELQAAIAKAVTPEQLKALADKVAALEAAGVPGVAAAVASVNAPAPKIAAERTWAIWNAAKHANGASATRFAALKKVFAEEIAALDEDGKPHDQGGYLPVIVNPSNVDLSEGYTFALQSIDGKVAEVEVAEVVEGVPAGSTLVNGLLTTKAGAEDCIWSLKVVPAKDKYNQYKNVEDNTALVIEDGEGVAYKTAFAYTYSSEKVGDVTITAPDSTGVDMVDGEVDVFESLFSLENEANGIFILSVENKADVARYGIGTTKDGKLTFSKFPSNQPSITIREVKLVALGLNGSTAEKTVKKVTVKKSVGDNATVLSDTTVTLKVGQTIKVRWDVAELGMDEAGKEDVLKAISATPVETSVTILLAGDTIATPALKAYRENGLDATTYKNFATFGFDVLASALTPNDYTVEIKIGEIFFGKATITAEYDHDAFIKLHEDLCKNGVLQITGKPSGMYDDVESGIEYNMPDGFKLATGVTITKIIDLDEDEDWSVDGVTVNGPKNQVGYEHNFSAIYTVGTDAEEFEYPFKAVIVSPIYFAKGEDAVDYNTANLTAIFNGTAAEQKIDLMTAIKDNKAKYAAGYNRGKSYNLFQIDAKAGTQGADKNANNFLSPMNIGNYVMNKDGESYVTITKAIYLDAFTQVVGTSSSRSTNYSASKLDYDPAATPQPTHYLDTAMWNAVMDTITCYRMPGANKDYANVSANDSLVWVWADSAGVVDKHGHFTGEARNRAIAAADSVKKDADYVGCFYLPYTKDSIEYASGLAMTEVNDTVNHAVDLYNAAKKRAGWKTVKKSLVLPPTDVAKTLMAYFDAEKNNLKYNQTKIPGDITGKVDEVKRAAELVGDPEFYFADVEMAKKYISNVANNGKIAISNGKAEVSVKSDVLDVPGGKVEVIVNMVVKDYWNKTMIVPIKLTLKTVK